MLQGVCKTVQRNAIHPGEMTRGPELVSCIACAGTNVHCVGPLPIFTPDLLGAPRDGKQTMGSLYACQSCRLRFRWPMPTEAELMAYYNQVSVEERWQYSNERQVWKRIAQSLGKTTDQSVLDVGCFRGDLLCYLGDGCKRYGIEPCADAREEAQRRGITILGNTVESFQPNGTRFDAITLIDVIEHLPTPLESLAALTSALRPGGKLYIFTGNTDAWSWRLAGLHYWYSALPEHVAFFCPRWFHWAAPKLGCKVSSIERMPHQLAPLRTRLDETAKNTLYVLYQRMSKAPLAGKVLPRLPILGRIGRWNGAWWTSARDHVLVTYERT